MIVAYLIFGMLVGAGAATLALINGSGLLLAMLAYSAGGSLALLAPLVFHMAAGALFGSGEEWHAEESNGQVNA